MAEANGKAAGAAKTGKKAREGRSPAFPFIDLQKALSRAEEFRVAEGKHSVPDSSAKKAWGLGEDTVSGRRTIAALGYFGLFDFEGSGKSRKVRLTPTALKILLDKQPVSPERDGLVKQVALAPTIHKEIWDKWGPGLPSDATFETYLVRDRGFSSAGASDLMSEYKNTVAFAQLGKSDKMSDDSEEEEAKNENEHEIPQSHQYPRAGKAKLMAGERELTTGLLSKEVSFRLIVNGPVGVREIERLISKLEFDKEILADDAEPQISDAERRREDAEAERLRDENDYPDS